MTNIVDFPLSMYSRAADHAISAITQRRPTHSLQAERDIANLKFSYWEHVKSGNQLLRMVRQCQEQANELLATADRIKEQLSFYGVQP